MKIYVDGCSYAAGAGLNEQYSLANLINANYDASYGGKGNQAILHDLYDNLDKFDIFVVSLTYSDRFQLFDEDKRIQILSDGSAGFKYFENTIYKDLYKSYHKMFYTCYNTQFYSKLTDAIADSIITLIEASNKQHIIYSWEYRNSKFKSKINFLNFNQEYFLKPSGHLNEKGMSLWAQNTLEKINEK
jgi:hypothetical protein